jgi:formylglycine-generating enzyme required for sulfatase activity
LFSSRQGTESFEDTTLGHGVFTYFVLRGLRGEASGSDGLVTFQDLAGYVTDSMRSHSTKTGHPQIPFQAGEASGDFLVAKVNSPNAPSPTPVRSAPAVESAFGKKPNQQASGLTSNVKFGIGRPGEKRMNPIDGLTYVWISPGNFVMGCTQDGSTCGANQRRPRLVTITNGFWLGQTEVTQEAYTRVAGTTRSAPRGDQLPANMLNWNDAREFCEGIGGRLPTEAEWEYAARAGTNPDRYGELDDIAWYGRNSHMQIHQVATKQPNPWDLYDMLGNVAEWVADSDTDNTTENSSDPQRAQSGTRKIIKGGNFANPAAAVTASHCDRGTPDFMGLSINGVRCVKE